LPAEREGRERGFRSRDIAKVVIRFTVACRP
jgi:hypothetical protein